MTELVERLKRLADKIDDESEIYLAVAEVERLQAEVDRLQAEVDRLKREWLTLHAVERMRFHALRALKKQYHIPLSRDDHE